MTLAIAERDSVPATTARMDVFEAIRSRRSIGKVLPDVPPRSAVEQILEAGAWAPNHHVTEPWRFVVIAGDARSDFGDAMARSKVAGMDPAVKDIAMEYDRAKNKALRAPVIIAVAVEIVPGSRGVEFEEIAAGAAAVQNMLLTAHALGLAAIWRTGDPAYSDAVKAFLGFKPADHLIGFIYLGYPAIVPERAKRTPASAFTRWIGWEE